MLLFHLGCLVNTALYEARKAALTDHDGDGFVQADDCDDDDASVFPLAPETCDGVDQDCNGLVDDSVVDAPTWYADTDGDGHGNGDDALDGTCERPSGYDDDALDCDDADAAVYPGADEVPYDGLDNDCDGGDLRDVDGDGHDATEAGGDDCDDGEAGLYPGAEESWLDDGTDNDCDLDAWDAIEWSTADAATRLDGVEVGGELGRRFDTWPAGDCLFANAPYTGGARGTIYAVARASGALRADSGGWAEGTAEGAYLSATVRVSKAGDVAVSEVSDRDGAGTVYVLDGGALCSGGTGSVTSLSKLTFHGSEPGAWFGSDAVWIEDLDGDGRDEVAITAPGASGGGERRGAAYLWFSPEEGPAMEDTSADLVLAGTQDASGLEGLTVAVDEGGDGRPRLIMGQAVAEAGTTGLFVVDASSAHSGPVSESAESGLLTWSTGRTLASVTVGDMDFDGSDDLVAGVWTFGRWDLADIQGILDENDTEYVLTYDADGEWLTGVAPAGDFDGDGRADLALLAEDWPQYTEQGRVALVPGEKLVGGSLDFASARLHASSSTAGESFGYRVATGADWDRDGRDDLVVAAPGAAHGGASSGSLYVLPFP